jgi:Fe-S cluster assembly iron-binding protein IscA
VVVDPASLASLQGSVIDFSLEQKGFFFIVADPYRRR